MNRRLWSGLIGGALVAAVLLGMAWYGDWFGWKKAADASQTASSTPTPTVSATPTPAAAAVYSYKGEDGKTALALLQEKYPNSVVSGEGEMAFVTAINGVQADSSKEFWALYVNGAQATVGAGAYVTKSGDAVDWRLEAFTTE